MDDPTDSCPTGYLWSIIKIICHTITRNGGYRLKQVKWMLSSVKGKRLVQGWWLYPRQPRFLCYETFCEMRSVHGCNVWRLLSSSWDRRMTSLNHPSNRKQKRNKSSCIKSLTVSFHLGRCRCSLNINYVDVLLTCFILSNLLYFLDISQGKHFFCIMVFFKISN